MNGLAKKKKKNNTGGYECPSFECLPSGVSPQCLKVFKEKDVELLWTSPIGGDV
jgi:hypothetical protein